MCASIYLYLLCVQCKYNVDDDDAADADADDADDDDAPETMRKHKRQLQFHT